MNLFFVSSPFQLINAIEAKHYYNCSDQFNILVILEPSEDISKVHLSSILKLSQWSQVITLSRNRTSLEKPRLVKLIQTISQYNASLRFNHIFYAEYSSRRIATILGNCTASGKEVLIDDGAYLLDEFITINSGKVITHSNFRRTVALKLFGLKPPRKIYPRKNFEIFTIFDLKTTEISVMKNQLSFIKDIISNKKPSSSSSHVVIFIGSGHANKELNIDRYTATIKTLQNKYPTHSIIYFPHRNESIETKKKIENSINNITYYHSDYPVELAISELGGVEAVYGYYSTALYTLSKLLSPIDVYCFRPSQLDYKDQNLAKKLSAVVDNMIKQSSIRVWQS